MGICPPYDWNYGLIDINSTNEIDINSNDRVTTLSSISIEIEPRSEVIASHEFVRGHLPTLQLLQHPSRLFVGTCPPYESTANSTSTQYSYL